jgi:ABC-type branched-subunit amino acid transport system ATPase component
MLDQTQTPAEPLLQAIGITKLYGSFVANDHIDLDLHPAQIHALLGENGAGKSTFVKIAYGLIQPNDGELHWLGRKTALAGPAQARTLGIGMVFQHFSLFENLTVAENIALGLPPQESFAKVSAGIAEISRRYGLPLEPRREVWRLSVGERQRIEIVRALMQNPKLLILDEPTSVLTPQEADQLFVVLESLKTEWRAIPYISHKLDEVKRPVDTATTARRQKSQPAARPRPRGSHDVGSDRRGEERPRPGVLHRACSCAISRSCPTTLTASGSIAFASRCAAGRSWGSPGSPATGRTSFSPRCRVNGSPTTTAALLSTARPPDIFRSPSAGASAPPLCPRNGWVMPPCRA